MTATTPAKAKIARPPNRRVPLATVLQMEHVECGAAALAIVLAHFGRIVPLEELRIACGVSRDGSKAPNILKAARRYGLEAKGKYYKKIEGLYELDPPVILWWNRNHFVVLGGFKRGKAYLSDPAQGPRYVPIEELDASFSSVALTFKPGLDFERGGKKPSMIDALFSRLKGLKPAVIFVLLCGLFLVVPGLVTPAFSRVFVDEYLIAGSDAIVKPLLLGMGLTAILTLLLKGLQEYFLLRLETKLAVETSVRFFRHVLRLPVAYFSQRFAAEIGSRVAINDKVARLLSGRLATTVVDCVMIVFYGALMFFYDWLLTSLVIGLSLLNVAALWLVARHRVDASRLLIADRGKLDGAAAHGLGMIETLKATGGETEFFARWAGYQAKTLRAEQRLHLMGEMVSIVPLFVNTAVTAMVLLVGGFKVMNGELTVGILVAYQSLTTFFTRPLNSLVGLGAILQELGADMNRLDDVLEHEQDPVFRQAAVEEPERPKLSGRIELREVTFGYSPLDRPLIEDFSLTIEPGQRLALIGASGSGKSTIARLVAGLYEPWKGEILFDGVPRRELPRKLLTNSVAMVDQEIMLFSGTVAENISMWVSPIASSRIIAASRDAAIAAAIETRDGAYQAEVEEGGRNFSGGQRQRLEIARALASDPQVLILDEATSALDARTEEQITDRLQHRLCTCLIIAHRLSTVRDCDQIVVMDRGKKVQGPATHEQLMSAPDNHYARLVEADQGHTEGASSARRLVGTVQTRRPVTGFPLRLRVIASGVRELLGEELPVSGATTSIGRQEGCRIVVPDPSISGHHAQLEITRDGSLKVSDHDSANGVFIGGQRVEEGVVKPGHRFTLGGTTFELLGASSDLPLELDKTELNKTVVISRPPTVDAELETAFEKHGEEAQLSRNVPLALSDSSSMWLVTSGSVTLALEDRDSGAPYPFLKVEEGQVFFGIDPRNFGFEWRLMAKGQAELRRFSLNQVQTLAESWAHRERISAMVSEWVSRLSHQQTKKLTLLKAPQVNLCPGELVKMQEEQIASTEEELVWIEMPDAEFLYDDLASLSRAARSAFFPLARTSWIELLPGAGAVTLEPMTTLECISFNRLWNGLHIFHRIMCECATLNRELQGVEQHGQMHHLEDLIEGARIEARLAAASVMPGTASRGALRTPGAANIEPLLRACQLVGAYQGLDVRAHPDSHPDLHFEDALHELATISRFRTRKIRLGDAWWKHDQGPILGRLREDQAAQPPVPAGPVALLPTSPSSYECVDPETGDSTAVTEQVALTLDGFGHAFYPPLPPGSLGTGALLRFAFRRLGKELQTVVLIGLGLGLLSILTPLITGLVYGDAIPQAERDILLHLSLGLLLVALTTAAFQISQKVAVLRVQGRADYSAQAAVWDRLLDLPMRFFRGYSAGDLADRAAGVSKIRNIIAGVGVAAVLGFFTSLFNLLQMGFYSLKLAAAAAFLSLFYVALTLGASILQVRLQRDELRRTGKIRGLALQLIAGVAKLRVSGTEDLAYGVWSRQYIDQRRVTFKVGRVANFVAVLNAVYTLISTLVIFALMFYLKQKAAESGEVFDLTTGDFLAFSAAFGLFQAAMQALGDASVDLLKVLPTFERMQPILRAEAEVDAARLPPGELKGGIRISHVSFRYSDDSPWVLKDLSLDIEPGDFIAIVGGSGSGKSTLLRLLLGFEKPDKGIVYYDAQDLAALDLRMVRQQLGVVLQDSRVFPAEISRNIVGASSRSVEDAEEAARQAGLLDDIRMMSMGMDTYISEGGGGLSGGQRQRLMIARALVNKPAAIFLDEATSALDNETQAVVTESMDRLEATRVVIAHRLSTIREADRICYLEDGTIKEEGTFDELMAQDGLFADMARRQLT